MRVSVSPGVVHHAVSMMFPGLQVFIRASTHFVWFVVGVDFLKHFKQSVYIPFQSLAEGRHDQLCSEEQCLYSEYCRKMSVSYVLNIASLGYLQAPTCNTPRFETYCTTWLHLFFPTQQHLSPALQITCACFPAYPSRHYGDD